MDDPPRYSALTAADQVGVIAQTEPDFKTSYIRQELLGGLNTPAWAAFAQMIDPIGFSAEQLDRNAAMHGPTFRTALERHPELLGQPREPPRQGSASLAEDMNSVMIKYSNWRKTNVGIELSPQERVTQGFIDVRNPNSRF